MSAESGFVKILNFIDGQFCEPVSGNYCDNINPSTGAVYSQWAQSNENDVELAVNASKKAFPRWKSLSNGQRSKILHRWPKYLLLIPSTTLTQVFNDSGLNKETGSIFTSAVKRLSPNNNFSAVFFCLIYTP